MPEFEESNFGRTAWSRRNNNLYVRGAESYLQNNSKGFEDVNTITHYLPDKKYGNKVQKIIDGEDVLETPEMDSPDIKLYEFSSEKFNMAEDGRVFLLKDEETCALAGDDPIVKDIRDEILEETWLSRYVDETITDFFDSLNR